MDSTLKAKIIDATQHQETGFRLLAERAYLRVLEGGCSIPVFALADYDRGIINLKGGIVSLDGSERIIHQVNGKASEAESIGQILAEKVLTSGGDKILKAIKSALNK
jgi:hydroxymethylbilane synthase